MNCAFESFFPILINLFLSDAFFFIGGVDEGIFAGIDSGMVAAAEFKDQDIGGFGIFKFNTPFHFGLLFSGAWDFNAEAIIDIKHETAAIETVQFFAAISIRQAFKAFGEGHHFAPKVPDFIGFFADAARGQEKDCEKQDRNQPGPPVLL